MRAFLSGWTWRMAWRESRTSGRRLLLFLCSITLGVASLVAVRSFSRNMERAVNTQSKELLGADLVLRSRQPLAGEAARLVQGLAGDQADEVRFSSMLYFPRRGQTRLAEIRSLEGAFPFYGRLETRPPEAARTFRQGPWALVDERMMLQFRAHLGDPVQIGKRTFRIAGSLRGIPGEALVSSLVLPRVFIPGRYLGETGLIQPGSRASYRTYFRFRGKRDVESMVKELEPRLRHLRLSATTVEERRRRVGRSLGNLYRFLNLVGFVALLLGGIGVASAVEVHMKQKLSSVATLRCLGARSSETFAVYLVQTTVLAAFGSLLGVGLGVLVQGLLPRVLSDFMPLQIPLKVEVTTLLAGTLVGMATALLFALLPLCGLRLVSPLLAVRFSSVDEPLPRDPLRWLVGFLILGGATVFAVQQSGSWKVGLSFAAALALLFGALALVAQLVTRSVRRFYPSSWSYVWRQGLANLYRPHNQTLVLILSLGLGTFLITTLFLVQGSLLNQVRLASSRDRPNLVLFDIQADQRQALRRQLREFDLPILQDVPIVTMRMASLRGVPVEKIARQGGEIPDWALLREYRSTYRDHLIDSETLVAGQLQERARTGEPARVSLEENIARRLKVKLGDRIVFDVQGVPVEVEVGSLRRVEWDRLQTNFMVVFPAGVLEKAPQFYVLVTRTPSARLAADLERRVVERFPNVSAVDLALVLKTVDSLLDRVAFVVRFMALFSVITGVMVLMGALLNSRYQRLRESVLLRTLGASRRQVHRIMLTEYVFLGTFASLSGLLLSALASWLLMRYLFESEFLFNFTQPALVLGGVVGLTVAVGVLNSWGLLDRPPLAVLREEG